MSSGFLFCFNLRQFLLNSLGMENISAVIYQKKKKNPAPIPLFSFVLVLAEIKLDFFTEACMVLCFGVVLKTVLLTQGYLHYC